MKRIYGRCCGIDVHKATLTACVRVDLLAESTTYRELGSSYFEQRRAEQLKRRCLDQLRTLGFQTTLTPLAPAA
jgi:hypothetical protein